jgi:hypothetical protein
MSLARGAQTSDMSPTRSALRNRRTLVEERIVVGPHRILIGTASLENYRDVVTMAAEALAPGGVLLTKLDPVAAGRDCVSCDESTAYHTVRFVSFASSLRPAIWKIRRALDRKVPAIGRLVERYPLEVSMMSHLLRLAS